MHRPTHDLIGNEPKLDECRTVNIENELYRCLASYTECMYATPAGSASNYCEHPNRKDFSIHIFEVRLH
jgi:hypothetical protein